MAKIYVAGSLRNPAVLETAQKIKDAGHEVFVDWFGGGPVADDAWRDTEKALGYNLRAALKRPMAQNIIQFDTRWLDWSDMILVVKPGTSSTFELARHIFHSKKPGYVLFPEGDPERWDVMLAWATEIFYTVDEFLENVEANRQEKFSRLREDVYLAKSDAFMGKRSPKVDYEGYYR